MPYAYHRNIATDATNPTGGNKPGKKNHCGFVACGGRRVDVHRPRYQPIREEKIPTILLLNRPKTTSKGAGRHLRRLSRNEMAPRRVRGLTRPPPRARACEEPGLLGGGGGVLDSLWGCALMVEVYRPQTGDASPPLSKQDGALVEWRWVLGGRPPPR